MNVGVLEHRGYKGSVEYSPEDDLFVGQVLGIKGLILYSGESVGDITQAFKEAVDEYISDYERREDK